MKTTKAVLDATAIFLMVMGLKAIHMRFALLWEAGIDTGLRVSDLLKLRVSDIAPVIEIVEKKNKNTRKIEFSASVLRDIRFFIKDNKLTKDEFIFFRSESRKDVPMSRQWAYSRIALVASQNGLKSIATHSMRKTYACRLYNATGSLEAVRSVLGHKRIETTILYLRDLLPGAG